MKKQNKSIILTEEDVKVMQERMKSLISNGAMLPLTKEAASGSLKKLVNFARYAEINEQEIA